MGEKKGIYGFLMGKPEVNRPGRPRHSWENKIKIDLQEVGCGCMDWIDLAHDRTKWQELVTVIVNLLVP
jgi:hypothetical protein